MAGILTLTFTDVGVEDEYINFLGNGDTTDLLTFKPTRNGSKKVTVFDTIATQVKGFVDAFDLDYNRNMEYTVTFDETTVTLEHFDNDHFDDFVDATHNNTTFITTEVTTTSQRVIVQVAVDFSEADTNVCNQTDAYFVFDNNIVKLKIEQVYPTGNITVYDNDTFNANSLHIDLSRASTSAIVTYEADFGETGTVQVTTPGYLVIENLIITENAYGGAVEIVTNNFFGSDENLYALGNSLGQQPETQSSNVFTSLAPGTYNALVEDKYGCTKTESFIITDEATNQHTYPLRFFYSEKNSIRLTNRTIDSKRLTANNSNFLTCESPDQISVKNYTEKYAESQSVRLQFKSSYPIHKAFLIPESEIGETVETDYEIAVTQVSQNVERQVYLEGNVTFNATYSRLAISFEPGNIYNGGGSVIGQHSFDGNLPLYYEVGTPVKVFGEAMVITDIIEDGNIEYAITSSVTNNPQTGATIESVHTELPYEVYECFFSMSDFPIPDTKANDKAILKLLVNKARKENAEIHLSEVIEKVTDEFITNGKWHVVTYWNSKNDSEVNYEVDRNVASTSRGGIKHLKNIEYTMPLRPISNAEIDFEKLDHKVTKLDYKTLDVYETNFKEVPTAIAKAQMKMINESEFIDIDGIVYTAIQAAEIEHKGQFAKVKGTLAVIGKSNELGLEASFPNNQGSATPYYPVVP